MNSDNTELLRRLDNLLRLGVIAEVDVARARVRVKIGTLLTDYLPWISPRAGALRVWSAPTIGEQCVVLAISGDLALGVVLTGIYTAQFPAPANDSALHTYHFPDGVAITYNESDKSLTAVGLATATIEASDKVTANTPLFEASNDVKIGGNLTVAGSTTSNGNIATRGSINATGEVTGNGISLSSHRHGEVESGNRISGGPQ